MNNINRTYSQFLFQTILLLILFISVNFSSLSAQKFNDVQLAKVYNDQLVSNYLVSEKLDGVRAIWKNGQLKTRSGNKIHAPSWFTENFPNVWLDGELWFERNNFEYVASTTSKKIPDEQQWLNIKYMVFDAPNYKHPFNVRATYYRELVNLLGISHLQAVEQFYVSDNEKLSQLLKEYVNKGAEGLMLHRTDAMFEAGRNNNLLKLKPYMDAEATVLAHLPGKGKYENSTGALLVKTINQNGVYIEFKIGSGFSDKERLNPPPVGTVITYQYHGYTNLGKPKFASFLHVASAERQRREGFD